MEQIFKTKTGFCHVFSDRIVFSKLGKAAEVKEQVGGTKSYSSALMYGILVLANAYFAYTSYLNERFGSSLFFVVMGIYLAYAVRNHLKFSAALVIPRDSILKIEFIEGTSFLTRSRFMIHFKNMKGELRYRLIMLPGSMRNGKEETAKALQIFKEEGLL